MIFYECRKFMDHFFFITLHFYRQAPVAGRKTGAAEAYASLSPSPDDSLGGAGVGSVIFTISSRVT